MLQETNRDKTISKKFIIIPCRGHNRKLKENPKGLTTGIQEMMTWNIFKECRFKKFKKTKIRI